MTASWQMPLLPLTLSFCILSSAFSLLQSSLQYMYSDSNDQSAVYMNFTSRLNNSGRAILTGFSVAVIHLVQAAYS